MADFSQELKNFKQYGTYDYIFDSVGNEVLNPSSSIFQQVYFSLPLSNYNYNESKILSFYNPTFTEFVPTFITSSASSSSFSQEAIDAINALTYQNTLLQNQVGVMIDMGTVDTSSADQQSIKNTIINLRIQNGQGVVPSDFQDTYPYLPIPFEQQLISAGG